jgi:hypothetical protein
MSNQTPLIKVLFVLGMLAAPTSSEYAIAMCDWEGLTIYSEIHLAGKDFQCCGVGMHRICLLGSCFYIVKFPSMWNNVEFIEDSIFKGMDLRVIEPRILRSDDDLASSVTYWTNFLNFGKGVAIFRLPKDDASSVLYVSYGLPQAMELDVQIPISEFKRSSCLVDQSFQALALCGLQLVPFVREFLFVKLIYDYSKCFL